MSQSYGAVRPFPCGGAIGIHLIVKLSAGKLAAAGATDDPIGTITAAAFADGDIRSVRTRNAEGSTQMVASAAITQWAVVYQAAGGKVAPTGTKRVGIAAEAATANGDIIEIIPDWHGGLKRVSGSVALGGSNPTVVATGLSSIASAHATFKTPTALGDDPNALSVDYTGSDGTLNVYAWKNTNGTDPTQVASTATTTICWTAEGMW